MKYGFGVDVGGTTCKLGFFAEGGALLEKWEIHTDTRDNGSRIPVDIAAAIENKLQERGIGKADVLGVGVGVPGPVLDDGTVKRCVNLGWGVINISQILGDLLQLPVKAGNDADVAALGEMWLGGGKGYENVVLVTLGTGVGGGIVLGGKILSGTNGAAGEIGHLKVNETETEVCGCGNCHFPARAENHGGRQSRSRGRSADARAWQRGERTARQPRTRERIAGSDSENRVSRRATQSACRRVRHREEILDQGNQNPPCFGARVIKGAQT